MFWVVCIVLAIVGYQVWDWNRSRKRIEGIHNKCVFITGCDSGFGNALARRLDVLGVPVFAGCLTETGASQLQESASERLHTVIVDVTNHESILRASQFVRDNIPDGAELWGLVNNAGIIGKSGPLEYMSREMFNEAFEVNLFGPVDVTLAFLPLLKQSEGRIINTSSMLAMSFIPGSYPYLTSKHAMRAFSGALRLEKEAYGINISTILPGAFQTEFVDLDAFEDRMSTQWNDLTQELREEFGENFFNQSMKHMRKIMGAQPKDISPVIAAYEHALFAQHPRDEYFPGKDSTIMSYFVMLPQCLVTLFFKMLLLMGAGGPKPKFLGERQSRKRATARKGCSAGTVLLLVLVLLAWIGVTCYYKV